MRIAFNPSTVAALTAPPNNKDITFDLRGQNIFARGVKFCGTDTNTWRDIKINNVSIGSNILDLRNGSNTTLTNTNGVVTINSTWRPVVDNLTSDSTTSSLSAKQGKILKSLIDGKSNSGHTHDDRYLKLTGGTMASNALITFADSGSWGTDKGPQGARGGLYWTGQSDCAKLYAEETVRDNLDLVIQFGDDNSNGLSIRNKANTQTSYISAGGVITTGTFKGNLDWSYITNKPSSYTPSAHTHAWNSLTHSSTTENQAILTNGKANGWKLQTLNIARWDNAANNTHSHSNKSVLDGITSGLVNNWNTAFTFVHTITGTDTDNVINKWDEIVNFLAGITEDNKLNTLLNSKLSIQQLSAKDILTTKTNNALFWVNTVGTASSITTGPFTDHPYALLSVTNYSQNDTNGKFFYRSRLAFSSAGDIKVASCQHAGEYKQDDTWYNVLTSKNSGISGSTIKLNGTSITVYSSGTADGRYVKKSGDTMSGALNFANGTWNKVGDDIYMGDHNIGGQLCLMGITGNTGISFHKQGDVSIRKSITFNGSTLYMNGNCDYASLANQSNLLAMNTVPNKTTSTSVGSWSPISGRYVFHQRWSDTSTGSDGADFGIYLDGNLTANMVLDGYYNSLLGFRVIGATGGFLKANGTIDHNTYLTSHQSLSNYYTKGEINTKLNNYLPLSGGTMKGQISSTYSVGTWIGGCTNAIIKAVANGYNSLICAPIKSGNVCISAWTAEDNLNFGYAKKGKTENNFDTRMYWDAPNNTLHATAFAGHLYGTADNAVNSDTTDGVHLEWSGELGANDYSWLAGWTNDGKKIKAVNKNQFATSGHTHDGRYVRAFGTSNDNIDSDWGQSFKTFDPIPSGTPPEKNPNISLLSIGENFNRRKQLAFTYSDDNIYYRRHTEIGFSNWRRLAFANEIPSSLKNPYSFNVFGVIYDGSAAKTVTTSTFISQVTEAASTITDGTMLITSYASNSGFADTNAVNVPFKRKAIHLWEYIKAKTDSLYATKSHNHDGRYVYNYGGTAANGQTLNQNALFMSTTSGISGDWWHILQAAWNGEYCWNSQIAFPTQNRNGMYYRSGLGDNTKWGSWVKLLDANNYSSTLDSRYYTETEVNTLLDAKLNRQNLSYGTWNPRGYNLAADYFYNGGDLSISESGGQIHVSVDGYFWQNEGQYRVLDTSDVAGLKGDLTVNQYLSSTNATWWPLIWGGSSHNNTNNSTGAVYKSHDKLSWQTSSQTLYATNIQTENIKHLSIGGGIYWNPNVESASDGSDAASITLVKSGVAGGTTLVLSQMNDANDTIQFKTSTAARLYHNSYPILTTQNTYVSNNKGYINSTEITQVNNSDTLDGWHKDNIQWTGYITSPNSLTSYWFKMYDITVTGYQYNDITITFLVSEGYSSNFSIFYLKIRQNGTNNSENYNLKVSLKELVGNLRDKVVAYYNNSTGNVQLWGNTENQWSTMNYTVIKKTTRTATDSSSLGTLTAQSFSSVQTPPSTGYTKLTMSRVGSVSYSDSTGSVHWNNVTNKPSTFNPAAHTHTVFKNNLMIKGTNGISDSASIHLGIGDSDTGFKWISDGKCQIYANNVAIGEWTSGGMNWLRNPTVNGNKVWNAGNDGSGSGLDADTVDGKHATDGRTFNGNINWGSWSDVWSDGTNKHPWYGFDHRYPNTGAYSTTLTDYFGMTIKTANTLRLDFGNLLLNGTSIYDINVASATKVIVNQHTSNDVNYPLVWSNQSNDSSVTENQLFKSWEDLYYNPKNKILAVGGYFMGPWARFTDQNGALVIGDHINARISAIGDQIIFNTGSALRFGDTAWNWNQWAGLKYTHSTKTIYLGIADNSVFSANSAQSGGTINLRAGVSTIETPNINFGNITSGLGYGLEWTCGNNDFARIKAGATRGSAGYLEIATADDGTEPIYVRQYTGVFGTVTRTLTLLDANGYSYFPSYINIGGNENNNSSPDRVWGSNGSDSFLRSYRTSALKVNYASSAGNASTLGGTSLGGIFTAFGNNAHNITATIGGVTKSFLVNYAADADKVDGVHITWAGSLTSTSHLVAWEADGSALRDINPANVSVGSANYASSADKTRALKYTGTGNSEITAYQTADSYMGRSGWASYIICNHGDGSTYYSQTIAMPFWGSPIYRRLENGTDRGWKKFYTEEAPPSWSEITGKPTIPNPTDYYWANNQITTSPKINAQVRVSSLGAGCLTNIANTVMATNWLRATGSTGIYFQDHAGGLYMSDDTWIRTYNNKAIMAKGYAHSSHNSDDAMLLAGGGWKKLSTLVEYPSDESSRLVKKISNVYELRFVKLVNFNNLIYVDGWIRADANGKSFTLDAKFKPYLYNNDRDLPTIVQMGWDDSITIDGDGHVSIHIEGGRKKRIGFFYTGRA